MTEDQIEEQRIQTQDLETFTAIINHITQKNPIKTFTKGFMNALTNPEIYIEKYCENPDEPEEDACNVTMIVRSNKRNLKLLAIFNVYSKLYNKPIDIKTQQMFFDKMDTTQEELGKLYVALLNTESKAVDEELESLMSHEEFKSGVYGIKPRVYGIKPGVLGGKYTRKYSRKISTKKRKHRKANKSRSKKI